MFDCVLNAYELYFNFEKTPLTKYTNVCLAKSSFFSKFKAFMSVFPKSIKPVKLTVFNKNQIFFYFHFIKGYTTNRSTPLHPDVVFIKSSLTFLRKLRFGCVILFLIS